MSKELGVSLAEVDCNVSSSHRSGVSSLPGVPSACLDLLDDLKDRKALGCFYFCDELTPCGLIVVQQLELCGYKTTRRPVKDLAELVRSRNSRAESAHSPQDLVKSAEKATQALVDLDVIVLDDQVAAVEELLPMLQNDVLAPVRKADSSLTILKIYIFFLRRTRFAPSSCFCATLERKTRWSIR